MHNIHHFPYMYITCMVYIFPYLYLCMCIFAYLHELWEGNC